MQFRNGVLITSFLVILGALSLPNRVSAAPMVVPPFDTKYSLYTVAESKGADTIPGIPSPYAGIAFKPGDPNTLLLSGYSYVTDANGTSAIYSIGVTRDANNHVNGFLNNAALLSVAPGLPGNGRGIGDGPAFDPTGVEFYVSPEDNSLSMIKPGSTSPDKQVDLSTKGLSSVGPLAFVPTGYQGAGRFKLVQTTGAFFDVTLQPDGSGTVNIASAVQAGKLSGLGPDSQGNTNVATGIVYVAAGNDQFSQQSILATSCDFNSGVNSNLVAYPADSNGSIIAAPRTVVTGLCADGEAVDPLTGDVLFTSFYGFPALHVLTGFTVLQPATPAPPTGFFESPGDGNVLLCWNPATGATSSNLYQVASASGTSPILKQSKLGGCATVAGLANGTTYFFDVTSVNSNGESPPSSVISVTLAPTPTSVPPAPTGLSGHPSSGIARVCWDPMPNTHIYKVYQVAGPGGASPVLQSVTNGGCAAISGLSNGTTYFFDVTGTNSIGEGPASGVIAIKPSP